MGTVFSYRRPDTGHLERITDERKQRDYIHDKGYHRSVLHYLSSGIIFVGTPDGVKIINLIAAIMLAVAFIPYGMKIIGNKSRSGQMQTRSEK